MELAALERGVPLERLAVGEVLRDGVPVGEDDTLTDTMPEALEVAEGLEEDEDDADADDVSEEEPVVEALPE